MRYPPEALEDDRSRYLSHREATLDAWAEEIMRLAGYEGDDSGRPRRGCNPPKTSPAGMDVQ